MPIVGLNSWIPTMNEFLQHWERVDDAMPDGSLKLTGGYGLGAFTADVTALTNSINSVFPTVNAASLLSAQRDAAKQALRERVRQYRLTVSGQMAGSTFANAAPKAPATNLGQSLFFAPLNKVRDDWTKINALTPVTAPTYNAVGFTPPLLLQQGYTLAAFIADCEALNLLWPNVESTTRDASFVRDTRNALMPPLRERMRQYRDAVQAAFPKDDPLVVSLPRLSPPAGNTPVGIGATGSWDAAINKARFTWTAVTDSKTDHISVRVTPGPVYHADDEVTIADLPKTATSFETSEGLGAPGAIANYKIYSVAAEGNENGGKAIEIIRPVT